MNLYETITHRLQSWFTCTGDSLRLPRWECSNLEVIRTEAIKSSGWLPWSSLWTLKLVFNVSSDDQGSHTDDLSVFSFCSLKSTLNKPRLHEKNTSCVFISSFDCHFRTQCASTTPFWISLTLPTPLAVIQDVYIRPAPRPGTLTQVAPKSWSLEGFSRKSEENTITSGFSRARYHLTAALRTQM